MKPFNENSYIIGSLGEAEILAQLAEECAELGLAALKLRRVLDGANPTPVKPYEARGAFIEEIADVANCLDLLLTQNDHYDVQHTAQEKKQRWADRLREDE